MAPGLPGAEPGDGRSLDRPLAGSPSRRGPAGRTRQRDGRRPCAVAGDSRGAISREAVTVDGEFGQALANGAEEVNNYWSSGDNILDEIFQIGEFGTEAVGAKGAPEDAETPDNYNDVDVTGIVRGHCLYYDPEEGCIDTVVENFHEGFQGGGDSGDKFDDWF